MTFTQGRQKHNRRNMFSFLNITPTYTLINQNTRLFNIALPSGFPSTRRPDPESRLEARILKVPAFAPQRNSGGY